MTILTIILSLFAWFLCGVLGVAILFYYDSTFKNDRTMLVCKVAYLSMFGPFILYMAILGQFIQNMFNLYDKLKCTTIAFKKEVK